MGTTVEVDRPIISFKKAAATLLPLTIALSSCANKTPIEIPTGSLPTTDTPLPTITPKPTETQILPSLPEGVSNLTVYNYETGKDEVLAPTFDEEMDTYVWKNEKGEVRRFLDKETGHVFAQTESARDNLIYQIDTEFGWEADLTQFAEGNKNYAPAAYAYLWSINNAYPGVLKYFNENTKLILKIAQGDYNDIADKSKISSTKDVGNQGTETDFFWPIYDEKNNTQTLKMYLANDYLGSDREIKLFTGGLLNSCLTTKYEPDSYLVGTISLPIPEKPIQ